MACKGCKKTEHECEECPEWIFTFADLVMLMMGFFVILWVLKPAPGKEGGVKQDTLPVEVVAAIRGAMGYLPDPQSKDPIDLFMLREKLGAMKLPQGGNNAGKTLHRIEGAEGTDPEVTAIRISQQTAVGGRIGFEPGNALLNTKARNVLNQIADAIRGHRNVILIKGHTSADDLPEKASPQEKMDLSIKRAQAVADYLIGRKVEPEILRVQGCSTFEPVTQQAYHLDTKALNRRVEVEATSTLVEELRATPSSAPRPSPAHP